MKLPTAWAATEASLSWLTAPWIGWLIAAAAVAVAVIAEFRRKPLARVQFIASDFQPLVVNPINTSVKVSATVAGRAVKNAYSVRVRIANTGRRSFTAEQWEKPMTVTVGAGREIIVASLSGVSPAGAYPSFSLTGDTLTIEPNLMNSGDLYEFTLICEGALAVPQVYARMHDLRAVKQRKQPYPPGTGKDGTMLVPDLVITCGIFPSMFLGLGLWVVIPNPAAWPLLVSTAALAGLLIAFERMAVLRSRVWRPVQRFCI